MQHITSSKLEKVYFVLSVRSKYISRRLSTRSTCWPASRRITSLAETPAPPHDTATTGEGVFKGCYDTGYNVDPRSWSYNVYNLRGGGYGGGVEGTRVKFIMILLPCPRPIICADYRFCCCCFWRLNFNRHSYCKEGTSAHRETRGINSTR